MHDTATERLRQTATDLFMAAIDAADPARALARQLDRAPLAVVDAPGRYILIAIGKAAGAMMREARRHIPAGANVDALVVTNPENATPIDGCTVIAGGHPVPDAGSARAGQAIVDLLAGATVQDRVVALISGGGSALAVAPVAGVSLADKVRVNQALLAAGVEIGDMNLVRQHLSRLKGGRMAALAAPAPLCAYILSDVIGDDLRAIASGPTVAPIGSAADAVEMLKSRGVFTGLPAPVQNAMLQPAGALPGPTGVAENILIGSNRHSLERMLAEAVGARIVNDALCGDVAAAAEEILRELRALPDDQPATLLFGGETTVSLQGDGLGGRNQELALRVALGARDLAPGWVFLSGGTDGRDGPTDAAGGLVDGGSLARMTAAGVDARALLANNDSYRALAAAGDLLMVGATGTNVADVQIILRR
jgi:glycerate 2-kinase